MMPGSHGEDDVAWPWCPDGISGPGRRRGRGITALNWRPNLKCADQRRGAK